MPNSWAKRWLVVVALCSAALYQPSRAEEGPSEQSRAALSDLGHELSECAAYFSLLASIVEQAEGPEKLGAVARHIRSSGELLLTQALAVARAVGIHEEAPLQWSRTALTEMVETVNGNPKDSLSIMQSRYGQPCNSLLKDSDGRFLELLKQRRMNRQ